MNNKQIIIKCPKCGCEYLASEIFYPDSLLGKPTNILRDDNGKIIFVEGEDPELEEEWECDKCGCTFKAKLDIKQAVEYKKELDFGEDFSINLEETDKEKLF